MILQKEEPSAPKSSRKGSAKKYRKIIYSDDDEASDDKDEDYNPAPKKSKGKIAFFPSSDVVCCSNCESSWTAYFVLVYNWRRI